MRKLVKICVICYFKTKKSASEIYDLLQTTLGDKWLRRSNIFVHFNKFKDACKAIDDDPRFDRPPTLITHERSTKILDLGRSEYRLKIGELTDSLSLSFLRGSINFD